MGRKKVMITEVHADGLYTIIETAAFLSVNKATVYEYFKKCEGFEYVMSENGAHRLVPGHRLLALKEQGYPQKQGRRISTKENRIYEAD